MTPQEGPERPRLRDADSVLAFPQLVAPHPELEAPLHAVDAVPRDRVAAAELWRREHAAAAVHLHLVSFNS